jgi:hypothetical protein
MSQHTTPRHWRRRLTSLSHKSCLVAKGRSIRGAELSRTRLGTMSVTSFCLTISSTTPTKDRLDGEISSRFRHRAAAAFSMMTSTYGHAKRSVVPRLRASARRSPTTEAVDRDAAVDAKNAPTPAWKTRRRVSHTAHRRPRARESKKSDRRQDHSGCGRVDSVAPGSHRAERVRKTLDRLGGEGATSKHDGRTSPRPSRTRTPSCCA